MRVKRGQPPDEKGGCGPARGREGIGPLVRSALTMWGRSAPPRMVFLLRAGWRVWRANARRARRERLLGAHIPTVLALSPTMRCNYSCRGCYSRGRPDTGELSGAELDALFAEAESFGVLAVVVTGGEPLLRDDLPGMIARHRRLLFVIITNGSLVTPALARGLRRCGNTITLVSIEGFAADTDGRRGRGAYAAAVRAMASLREAGAFFGFAATNTAANSGRLGSDAFIDRMIALGCSVGVFTEYVPCGPASHPEWVLDGTARDAFRRRVLDFRGRKPIVLVQFPQDEYGAENRCTAAGQASLHISSVGGIEPCPFVSLSRENIRDGGLAAACRSSFLAAIRANPALLCRSRYACSLFEHLPDLEALAGKQ